MKKICRTCKNEKPLEAFKNSSNRCKVCLDCLDISKKKWGVSSNKRNKQYLKRYNITLEQYDLMLEKQNNSCAICLTSVSELSTRLHVDHCHLTGKVRGLLCYNCNSGLGRFKDDKFNLSQALHYIMCA
jgi:hypothetical protein